MDQIEKVIEEFIEEEIKVVLPLIEKEIEELIEDVGKAVIQEVDEDLENLKEQIDEYFDKFSDDKKEEEIVQPTPDAELAVNQVVQPEEVKPVVAANNYCNLV